MTGTYPLFYRMRTGGAYLNLFKLGGLDLWVIGGQNPPSRTTALIAGWSMFCIKLAREAIHSICSHEDLEMRYQTCALH